MRHVCCYSESRLQMVHLRPAWGGHVLFDALIGRESVFGTLYITIFLTRISSWTMNSAMFVMPFIGMIRMPNPIDTVWTLETSIDTVNLAWCLTVIHGMSSIWANLRTKSTIGAVSSNLCRMKD